ncbi:MAG TPA: Gfo/Idh/MocA family oxidoreductase, partial [Vicinamibacteria bacterium]
MVSRRSFLTKSAASTLVAGAARACSAWAQPLGANDAVRVAVVGLHGKGAHHVEMLKAVPGVRIVALCDVDEAVLHKHAAELSAAKFPVAKYVDVRRLLESREIDAITIATPNHWHALMTIWACQAGKDVYVEKPVSHNVWEGRQIVEAAARYGRIVQAGTQSRSDEALLELAREVRAGKLGRIVRARGFCYKRRESIGRVDGPQPIPASVDYDLFCGPAPLEPLRRRQLHYDWHWFWATGNGDIGNQGVHEMDVCRWMLGEEKLPPRVFSIGGRFGYVDDAETPNTQVAVLDYPSAPILFEVRGLPRRAGAGYEDHYRGVRIGYVIEGEDATFVGASGGGWIHDREGKKVRQLSGGGDERHMEDWIRAVRSRRPQDLKAPVAGAHLSSALCHLANISHRLGTARALADARA